MRFFRYFKKSKNTCEKFASKKARNCKKKDEVGVKGKKRRCEEKDEEKKERNCKKKDEFGVRGKDARVLGVRAAVGPDARAQVPLDVRRVRRLRGLRELVLQEEQEHVRGLRVQEEQELQEEGRVGHEGEESLSDDLRRVLISAVINVHLGAPIGITNNQLIIQDGPAARDSLVVHRGCASTARASTVRASIALDARREIADTESDDDQPRRRRARAPRALSGVARPCGVFG